MADPRDNITLKRIYPPASECIYCGARHVPLTDEHTIPEGLGGRHILPQSSCKLCQTIINEQFEQYCLRTLFSNIRAVFGLKSKKKRKEVRHSIRIRTHAGEVKRVYMAPEDVPMVFAIPAFPEPYFITGQEMTGNTVRGAFWQFSHPPIGQLLKQFDAESILTDTIYPDKLARFIAKMAHAHAWALWGGDAFEPFLPPIILGKTNRYIDYVGGRLQQFEPEEGAPFQIFRWSKHADGQPYLIASIRMFAQIGAPVYYAVIGRALKPSPLLERQH